MLFIAFKPKKLIFSKNNASLKFRNEAHMLTYIYIFFDKVLKTNLCVVGQPELDPDVDGEQSDHPDHERPEEVERMDGTDDGHTA